MATVYLHIGTPKTGTTALQFFLPENNEILRKHGVEFPDFGFRYTNRGLNHNGRFLLGAAKLPAGSQEQTRKEQAEYQAGLEKLKALAQHRDRIILSEEGLWPEGAQRPGFWQHLKKDMDDLGIELKIIVYLRRQDDFVQSHWAQLVKNRGSLNDFREHLQWMAKIGYPLDYEKYLREIRTYVGVGNMIVRVYDKSCYVGAEGTIFSDFLAIFGLRMADGFEVKQSVYNTSLSGDTVELRRMMNRVKGTQGGAHPLTLALKQIQEIDEFANGWKDTMCFESEEEHQRFMAQYEPGNAAIAREYLGREDGVLFPSAREQRPYQADADRMIGELAVLLADMTVRQQKEIGALQKELRETRKELEQSMLWFRCKRKVKHLLGKDKKA
ncbi:MAG: hypothetical protein Q4B57_02525 [Eubacteriales bacterium]|nr:hypothetical protein [Eubacteriales bacterium]